MAMSDCYKCFETPCSCGYNYRTWSDEKYYKWLAEITRGRQMYINDMLKESCCKCGETFSRLDMSIWVKLPENDLCYICDNCKEDGDKI